MNSDKEEPRELVPEVTRKAERALDGAEELRSVSLFSVSSCARLFMVLTRL